MPQLHLLPEKRLRFPLAGPHIFERVPNQAAERLVGEDYPYLQVGLLLHPLQCLDQPVRHYRRLAAPRHPPD